MKAYKIVFNGVKLGSIGKPVKHTITLQAESWKDANLKMYDTHEHIYILSVNGQPFSYQHPQTQID